MKKKSVAKVAIFIGATVVCIYGGMTSAEPMNYVLWWLMFLLVVIG